MLHKGYENAIFIAILVGSIIFGSKKLSELARSLGRVQAEFEKARIEAWKEIPDYDNDGGGRASDHAATTAIGISHNLAINDCTNATSNTDDDYYHQLNNTANISKSDGLSLVNASAGTNNDNDDDNNNYMTKLQKAAKKLDIENSEKYLIMS